MLLVRLAPVLVSAEKRAEECLDPSQDGLVHEWAEPAAASLVETTVHPSHMVGWRGFVCRTDSWYKAHNCSLRPCCGRWPGEVWTYLAEDARQG